jgi:hypothetical protein
MKWTYAAICGWVNAVNTAVIAPRNLPVTLAKETPITIESGATIYKLQQEESSRGGEEWY